MASQFDNISVGANMLAEFREKIKDLDHGPERAKALFRFSRRMVELDPAEGMKLLEEAVAFSKQIGYAPGEGYRLFYAAFGLFIKSDYAEALNIFMKSLQVFKDSDCREGEAEALAFSAYIYWDIGEYDKAFRQAFAALAIAEEVDMKEGIAWIDHSLGVFYYNLKDYATALKHFYHGLEIFKEVNYQFGQARILTGIGSIFIDQHQADAAVEHINEALKIFRTMNQSQGIGRSLNDLGTVFKLKKDFSSAEKYLLESLVIREKVNHNQGIITTRTELGDLYLESNRLPEALDILNKALSLASSMNVKPKIFRIHKLLGEVYKKMNDPWKSLEHTEKYFEVKSDVAGDQVNNKLKHMQTSFATERAEKEAEIERLKNVELKKAYQQIEEKNRDILDSLTYARRIQQAILPLDEEIKKHLPDSFVFFKPRDIVSGDFYWFTDVSSLSLNFEKHILFAAVDCTGHGVPGAFMCMIGNTLLNQIVLEKRVIRPDQILFHLREEVIRSLKQTGADGENRDGMDIALISIKFSKTGIVLEFAGANNPLWLIQNGAFKEIPADKQPIGVYHGNPKPFILHEFELNKGDFLYIFTDGYADQFGGEKGKKFKYKQLQETLTGFSNENMENQKIILEKKISGWKGDLEQVDDILVAGIRI